MPNSSNGRSKRLPPNDADETRFARAREVDHFRARQFALQRYSSLTTETPRDTRARVIIDYLILEKRWVPAHLAIRIGISNEGLRVVREGARLADHPYARLLVTLQDSQKGATGGA